MAPSHSPGPAGPKRPGRVSHPKMFVRPGSKNGDFARSRFFPPSRLIKRADSGGGGDGKGTEFKIEAEKNEWGKKVFSFHSPLRKVPPKRTQLFLSQKPQLHLFLSLHRTKCFKYCLQLWRTHEEMTRFYFSFFLLYQYCGCFCSCLIRFSSSGISNFISWTCLVLTQTRRRGKKAFTHLPAVGVPSKVLFLPLNQTQATENKAASSCSLLFVRPLLLLCLDERLFYFPAVCQPLSVRDSDTFPI